MLYTFQAFCEKFAIPFPRLVKAIGEGLVKLNYVMIEEDENAEAIEQLRAEIAGAPEISSEKGEVTKNQKPSPRMRPGKKSKG